MKKMVVIAVFFVFLFCLSSAYAGQMMAKKNYAALLSRNGCDVVLEVDEAGPNVGLVGVISVFRGGTLIFMKVLNKTGDYTFDFHGTMCLEFYFNKKKGELTASW